MVFLKPFPLSVSASPENHVPVLREDSSGEPRRRGSCGLGSASAASEPSSVIQGRSSSGSRRRMHALHGSLAGGGRCQAAWRQDGRHSLKATLKGAQLSEAVAMQRRNRGARFRKKGSQRVKKKSSLVAPFFFSASLEKKKLTLRSSAFVPLARRTPRRITLTHTSTTTPAPTMNALALRRCSIATPSSSGRGAGIRPNKAMVSTHSTIGERRRRTSSSVAAYKCVILQSFSPRRRKRECQFWVLRSIIGPAVLLVLCETEDDSASCSRRESDAASRSSSSSSPPPIDILSIFLPPTPTSKPSTESGSPSSATERARSSRSKRETTSSR